MAAEIIEIDAVLIVRTIIEITNKERGKRKNDAYCVGRKLGI